MNQHSGAHTEPLRAAGQSNGEKPGPRRITFDTNPDDCNLHCIMCEDHSPYSRTQTNRRAAGLPRRRMDIGLIRQVLEESKGSPLREIIPSTMGEPLLYRHFDKIIDLCAEYGVMLNLTTNGTFPQRGAKAWAERIVPVTSDVKISWNGSSKGTQESVMLGTNWETVLDNVRTFVQVRDYDAAKGGNRCRVTFQLTFMEINFFELPDVVKLAANLGVDRVKGHHLWVHFNQMSQQSMRRSPDAIEGWNATVAEAYEAAKLHRLPNGRQVLLENIFKIDPNDAGDLAPGAECPFLGKEAWIASDGRFNPCCAPDVLRRTLGDFGNVNHTSLYDVWESTEYQRLRVNYMQNALCQGCNMRRPGTS